MLTKNSFRDTILLNKTRKRILQLKTGDKLYGFKVTEEIFVKESGAPLYTLEHESGARLAFLGREDSNKTFSISFLTPPEDDTGVFHIIEHSTLCGSEKFPIKEPFVELLKGSLNTFLNAMTYEDRTVYPVSSRCDKDFYNLVNIYLDAVFHPMMKQNRFIFEQEGWRYEYDEQTGALSYNGVVYNEMKGAYSSPDELGYSKISKLLYSGSYGKDSGGDPDFIPELTYEKFCALHDKYYHPSNSYIYLDGSVELDSILPLIDSYLKDFSKREDTVTLSAEKRSDKSSAVIEFEATEDSGTKARMLLGYPFSDYSRTDEKILSSVITAYLAGSNEAPLTKALLDSGLCEDVILSVNYSNCYTLTAEIKGFAPEDKDKLTELFNSVIEKECLGMDRESLHASLNLTEFKLRERDLGAFPVGIANAISVYELWSYGAKPSDGLVFEEDISRIRAGIDSGEAEKLLAKMIRDNDCSAEVLMLPSKDIADKRDKQLKKLLAGKLSSFSEKELSDLKENQTKFTAWQHSEDSEEALAHLPTLTLADISAKESEILSERSQILGADVIRHRISTRGITYLSMYFDGSDLSDKELARLSLLSLVLTNLQTEKYSPIALKNEIKSALGSFTLSAAVIANSKKGFAKPAVRVSASSLDTKTDKLVSLILEVLNSTSFESFDAVKKMLVQSIAELEDIFTSSGEAAAMGRVEAMSSPHGRISELLHGYDYYLSLKSFLSEIERSPKEFMHSLEILAKKLFVKERLTLSITSEKDGTEEAVIRGLAGGSAPAESADREPLPSRREGVQIPSRVGYASMGCLTPEAKNMLGALRVARSILSYEYLWNEIRVKGGAYGAGFVTRRDGGIYFYSYRDPSPERSLAVFRTSAKYLREIAESGIDLTKFIIGAYGEYDVLRTPKTAAAAATADLLTGWTSEDETALREGIVGTTSDSLLLVAELLDSILQDSHIAVSASRESLSSFETPFDEILKI